MEMRRTTKRDRRRILFVGGLPAAMPEEPIFRYFQRFGEVIRVKIMKDKKSKLPKGYAFVTMANHHLLPKLVMEKHEIEGRRVDCQIASKKGEKQAWKDEQKRRRVFVTGLSLEVTSPELIGCLEQFGKIRNGYVIQDYETKVSKRYGYVEFEDAESANRALSTEVRINGAKIVCLPYVGRHEPKKPKAGPSKDLELNPAKVLYDTPQLGVVRERDGSEDESDSSEEASEALERRSCDSVPVLTTHQKHPVPPPFRRRSDKRPSTEHLTLCKYLLQANSNYRFNIQTTPGYSPGLPSASSGRQVYFERSPNEQLFRRHSTTDVPDQHYSQFEFAPLLLKKCQDSKLAQRRSLF
jgi:RNA recognition motif-containing protein